LEGEGGGEGFYKNIDNAWKFSRVTCKLCHKSLAYHNSTSSMASHLRRYHREASSFFLKPETISQEG
jgi:hypothetical protein